MQNGNRESNRYEGQPIRLRAAQLTHFVGLSLLSSCVVLGVAWYGASGSGLTYWRYAVPAVIGYGMLMGTVAHVLRCGRLACMSGMMVGMTTGMLGGFWGDSGGAITSGRRAGCLWEVYSGC